MNDNITIEDSKWIGNLLGANWSDFTPEQFKKGLDAELKPGLLISDVIVTGEDLIRTGKIVLKNLIKHPGFYNNPGTTKIKQKSYNIDASIDSIVDSPFTETYQGNYKENRRENRNYSIDE